MAGLYQNHHMTEIISAIVVAVAIIIISRLVSKYFTTKLFAATVLVAIAFIYVGFSLKDNPTEAIILECAVALALYFLALIGYTRNNALIAYGIMFHGLWDILHHHGVFIKTDVPHYWPLFCLIVDIIDGLYFLYIFSRRANAV